MGTMTAGGWLSLIGGVMGATGAISEGQAAKSQAGLQAAINEQQASRERQISAAEERDFRQKTSQAFAERRAAMGKSGVDIGTGTPLMAASDFAAEAELNALRIREGGITRAERLQQEADLMQMAGRGAAKRERFRAGASLLTGLGTTFSK